MRRVPRAAALSAAALLFCAASGLASPAIAQRANTAPPVSAEALALDDATDPATPGDGENSQAPVVIHAIASTVPQSVLDQQPGDVGAGERSSRSLADLVGDYAGADTLDEESDCL